MLNEEELERLFSYVADDDSEQARLTRRLIADVLVDRDRIVVVTESPMVETLLDRIGVIIAREEAVAPRLKVRL